MDRASLESLDRETLIARAESVGVAKARVLTRPELVDEILLRDRTRSKEEVRRARGFLGLARDLLARVVEQGLHLPDAAERIRGVSSPVPMRRPPQAVPTVTLAEIYATQGHRTRAVDTLEQVLSSEPDHAAARTLLDKLRAGEVKVSAPTLPPEKDVEEAAMMGSSYMEEGESRAPQEPASMLDAEPLPQRYGVDECIAIAVDPTTLYVYWEIQEDTFEHLRARMPGGAITLRVLVILPTWDGPRSYQRDVEVHAAVGDWFVRELPEGAVVRAAVGYKSAEGVFVSASHSRGVEPSRKSGAAAVAQWLVRWTPEATISVGPAEPEAQKLARALARIEARRLERAAASGGANDADSLGRELGPAGSSERMATSSGAWSGGSVVGL